MAEDVISTTLDSRPYTVGSTTLRFHGATILDRANLIAIFEKIASVPQGAALFEGYFTWFFGLDVYLTTTPTFAVHPKNDLTDLTDLRAGQIHINLFDGTSPNQVTYIDQYGNVVGYELWRVVLHELIHATADIFDNPDLRTIVLVHKILLFWRKPVVQTRTFTDQQLP